MYNSPPQSNDYPYPLPKSTTNITFVTEIKIQGRRQVQNRNKYWVEIVGTWMDYESSDLCL